jgi:energy-coupling factor transport system permease protein
MSDAFAGYHPLVNCIYFVLVLAFSMTFTPPACLAVSFACSLAYSAYLERGKTPRFYSPFVLLATALINPAFNHEGATILTYLPSGNPLTLESIIYGAAAGVMAITVIGWFSRVNQVFTSDKFIYLFGRAIPSMSLMLSMTLRMIPRYKAQLKIIRNAQRCVGRDASNGGLIRRARNGLHILSIMTTWALENAAETADSMKSRGYGLPGRSAFSIYQFGRRDRAALTFIAACGGYVGAGAAFGGLYFRYFPTLKGKDADFFTISLCAVYFALCVSPLIMNIWEDVKWKSLESKI